MSEKILIIKPGYSETLVNEISKIASLGDVLRSTVILHLYKDAHITWLVDEKALPLLRGNPYLNRILPYELTSVLQLQNEEFDTVINFEKVPGICAFSDSIKAWKRYGFRFDTKTGSLRAYDGSHHALELCLNPENNRKYWEEMLFEMVGRGWSGELPILGYKPKSKEIHDIGFNYCVGDKWPIKAWPKENWQELELLLDDKYSISWQEGLKNLEDYIEWINSCRLIVTNDSLGLHIAHALNKKIVALFGPTNSTEVFVKNGIKLLPEPTPDCLPCTSNKCFIGKSCMYGIKPDVVFKEINKLMEVNYGTD